MRNLKLLAMMAMTWMQVAAGPAMASDALKGLADPTRPDRAGRAALRHGVPLVLQSTLVSGGRRTAVINGRLATTGSVVQGAKVLEIRPDAVIVRRDGRELTLPLQSSDVRQTRKGAIR